jgi:hypothetical protein
MLSHELRHGTKPLRTSPSQWTVPFTATGPRLRWAARQAGFYRHMDPPQDRRLALTTRSAASVPHLCALSELTYFGGRRGHEYLFRACDCEGRFRCRCEQRPIGLWAHPCYQPTAKPASDSHNVWNLVWPVLDRHQKVSVCTSICQHGRTHNWVCRFHPYHFPAHARERH